MKSRSLVAISCLVALGVAPLAAQAHGPQKAANACIQAFVDNYLPKNQPVNVRKYVTSSNPLSMYATRYTIELSARRSRASDVLVSVRCVANSAGQVIALEGPAPLHNGAELGARLK